MSAERLQKVLATAGIASRRDCEELIAAGRVTVNGKVMHTLGARVNPESDEILVDGAPIQKAQPRTYMLLNKPTGVISTAEDTHNRPTVVELVPSQARLFPVGRLDQDSEGLILLTDDGALTQRLTHPSYNVEKEYRALLDRTPDADSLREWREGVELEGEQTAPAWVDVQEKSDEGTWIRIGLHEGRKRQIREVAKLLGYEVKRLIRVREGSLTLGDVPLGESRPLTDAEVESLWQHVGGRPGDEDEAQAEHARPTRSRPSAVRSRARQDDAEAERPRRSSERSERPSRDDSGQRDSFGARSERGPREGYRERGGYAGREDRPARTGNSNRSQDRGFARDDRPRRDDSRQRDDRPRTGNRSYGNREDRPQNDYRNRDDRGPRNFSREDRPQREGYRDRPSYGSRSSDRGFSRDDRPRRSDQAPRDGNRSYGNREDRPQREGYRDRPSYGSRDQRSGGYNRDDRGPRNFSREDRPQREGYRDRNSSREDRPQREGYRDRPSYGNREDRPQREGYRDRPSYGNRDQRSGGYNRDARGPRNFSREDRPQREGYRDRPSYGNREDRPQRSAGGRPQRSQGNYNDRGAAPRTRTSPASRSRSDAPPRSRSRRNDDE